MGANGPVGIALIGDHNPAVTAHRAIPLALALRRPGGGLDLRPTWIHTAIDSRSARRLPFALSTASGACPPARTPAWPAPYAPSGTHANPTPRFSAPAEDSSTRSSSTRGTRWASPLPTTPRTTRPAAAGRGHAAGCSLVERSGAIRPSGGSRARALCGTPEPHEEYHCSYGLNPAYEADSSAPDSGSPAAIQPARRALSSSRAILSIWRRSSSRSGPDFGGVHPLIAGFVTAARAPPSTHRGERMEDLRYPIGKFTHPAR